jgi:uncharacterized protein
MTAFVWYELMTADPEAAADYYAKVVGWTAEASPVVPGYIALNAGSRAIAGVMAPPPGAEGMPAGWHGYVGVDDVDAAAERIVDGGGSVRIAPMDIPMVGRFAAVADPQGVRFLLFKGASEAAAPLPYMTPGSIGWHELHTSDLEGADAFYAGQFGWEKDSVMDTPMGPYQLTRMGAPHPTGALFKSKLGPMWLFYFAVSDIDAATDRLIAHGGTKMHGPMEVPGGAWVTMATDPQGAAFAIVGMKTSGGVA